MGTSRQYWKDPERYRNEDKKRRTDNPEYYKKKNKEWRTKNHEHYLETQRLWRLKNKKSISIYNKIYSKTHNKVLTDKILTDDEKEAVIIKKRKVVSVWYQKNKEHRKKYLKQYILEKMPKAKIKGRGAFCENCKISIKCVLDVHHIIPKSDGGIDSNENKMTLCANCHRMVHEAMRN